MVSQDNPRKAPKVSRHDRTPRRDTLVTPDRRLVAGIVRGSRSALRVVHNPVTSEEIEVDGLGVVLIMNGRRHVLHQWGWEPGIYIPK